MSRSAVFVQDGKNIRYTNGTGSDISAGDVVPMDNLCGVALVDIANGAYGTVTIEGVFEVTAVNDTAFTVGEDAYWDTSASKVTTVSDNNIPMGTVIEAKAETATKAKVKLNF